MKISFLAVLTFLAFSTIAQVNPANLDFERRSAFNDIAPWSRTSFRKAVFKVSLDSIEKHSGKYSLRTQYDTLSKDKSDGTVTNMIPIDVIGKKIKISAYVKTLNADDTAIVSFSISQDRGLNKRAIKGFTITGVPDWKLYSSEFNTDTLNFPLHNALLIGYLKTKGAYWLDDIKIEVDGKDMYSIPSFNGRNGEIIKQLSAQQITNIEMLCYVWGFLKYYHPVVARGKFNWDMELFKKISEVKSALDNKHLSLILSTWIDSLGKIPECKHCLTDLTHTISYNIDLTWMNSKAFSKELSGKLKYILSNRHIGDGYYAKYQPVKNLLFINENEYNWREKIYPNELFRLQFLFRYWNTIQYFSPYKNIIGKDWKDVLREFIPKISEAKDSVEYHIVINQLIHSVNDSHTYSFDQVLSNELGKLYVPVQIKIIEDKAVIYKYFNDSLAKANGLQVGDVITKVNGRTIKQIIDDRISLVGGSNYPRKITSLIQSNFILGGKDSAVILDIIRNDKNYRLKIKRYNFSTFKYINKPETQKWKMLDDNVGYVNMGILEKTDVDLMFQGLKTTKAIIFDLRNYPKGTFYKICSYLYPVAKNFALLTYPDLNYPGAFKYLPIDSAGPFVELKTPFTYQGKVVLLVNELTQSHAEFTAMALQAAPSAITFGSQTSGADGSVSGLTLTGNYFINMTGLGVFYPDRTPTQRVGVKINIEVKPTIRGVKEGRDEVLESATSWLKTMH